MGRTVAAGRHTVLGQGVPCRILGDQDKGLLLCAWMLAVLPGGVGQRGWEWGPWSESLGLVSGTLAFSISKTGMKITLFIFFSMLLHGSNNTIQAKVLIKGFGT